MPPAAAPAQQQPAVRDTPDAFVYLPRTDIESLLKKLNKQEHIKYSEVGPLAHASSMHSVYSPWQMSFRVQNKGQQGVV